MIQKLKDSKVTLLLVLAVLTVILAGYFGYQKFISKSSTTPVEEKDLTFDAEGPYAILTPRTDGNALILDLKRTASYDSISYELAYVAQPDQITNAPKKQITDEGDGGDSSQGGIDRGVVGNIDTKDKKGEYTQEILFGTCSKNVCKYDQGVENGTLTIHIRKGNEAYRMITQWHLQKPDIALGKLISGDAHFMYTIDPKSSDLSLVGFTIINELTGAPKLPSGKTVLGKVYAVNVPSAKNLPAGDIKIEEGQAVDPNAKIYEFADGDNDWTPLDTQVSGNTLIAKSAKGGVFSVLVNSK